MARPISRASGASSTVATLKSLGDIVRSQRSASALRIDDAASLSGVSVDLLSRLENGRSGVGTDKVLKVLDALGLAMLVVPKEQLAAAIRVLRSTENS